MSYHAALGYLDRRAPSNATQFPGCATQAQHDYAHTHCQPSVLRGLGRALGLLDLSTTNQCWVETLPICPPPTAPRVTPIIHEPPRRVAPPPPAPATRGPIVYEPPRQIGRASCRERV